MVLSVESVTGRTVRVGVLPVFCCLILLSISESVIALIVVGPGLVGRGRALVDDGRFVDFTIVTGAGAVVDSSVISLFSK